MTMPDDNAPRGSAKHIYVVLYPVNNNDVAKGTPGINCRKETFEQKTEALAAVKKTPGARFKVCSSIEEAERQVTCGTPTVEKRFPAETSPAPEPSLGFPSVSLPMLSGLRMVIESGDVDEFTRLVWSNPKYLIGYGEAPTLLREGNWRRNGLHIAATAGRPEMIDSLLHTIRDAKFLQMLNPNDSDDELEFKAQHIVDLYLNNREARNYNTPLHCAVASRCIRSVEMLVACSECKRFEKNKFGETPYDLIPSSLQDWEIKRLTQLLGSGMILCYDTNEGPKLEIRDAPVPAEEMNDLVDVETSETEKLRAIAGPIPPGGIEDFFVKWKRGGSSTPRRSSNPLASIAETINRKRAWQISDPGLDTLRGDYKKGMERVGRQLCREYEVSWAERWDFLDDFLDITATDGLKKLDDHLRAVRDECIDSVDVLHDSFIHVVDSDPEDLENDRISNVASTPKVKSSRLVLRRVKRSPEAEELLSSPPKSPFERPSNPIPPEPLTPISALCDKMAALLLETPTTKRNVFKDSNKLVELSFGSQYETEGDEPNVDSAWVDSAIFAISLSEDVEICDPEVETGDWDNDDSFVTAPGTPEDEEWRKSRPNFYIGGLEFGQQDAQVFIALKDSGFWTRPNTEVEFPMVHDWFFRVVSKFTLRQIEERARRGVKCEALNASFAIPSGFPATPTRSSPSLTRYSSSSSQGMSSPASAPSIANTSISSGSSFPFSPCQALESAFASPHVKAKRRSMIK